MFNNSEIIISDCLQLLPWTEKDLANISLLFMNQPQLQYMDYCNLDTESDCIDFLADYQKLYSLQEKAYWNIYFNEEEAPIGFVGLSSINKKHLFASISFMLRQQFTGNGYMSAVIKGFCSYIFRNTELNRIEAQVYVNNYASINLLEVCNFSNEGKLRQNFLIQDQFCDSYMYSILRTEIILES